MKNNIIYIIILIAVFLLGLWIGNKNKPVDNNEDIKLELKEVSDSLLSIVKSYKPTDLREINNYYTTKYEKETKFIIDNNVDSNILFFSKWYEAIRQDNNR